MATSTFGLRTFDQPAFRRIVILVLLALLVAFRVWQFLILSFDAFWANDFGAYWTAGRNLLSGASIYSPAQLAGSYIPEGQALYLYPPPFAVVIAPLAALFPDDLRTAGWVWAAIGASLLAAAVVALNRVEDLGRRLPSSVLPAGPALVIAAFVFPPVIGELAVGNVHLELVGLLTLGWLGARRSDGVGNAVAGIAIGTATILKLFPALLILWAVVRGRRSIAVWALVAMATIAALSVPFTGLQAWFDYPRVLANMGPITDLHDSVAPAVWLAPILGFDVARWLVIGIGAAMVVLTARARSQTLSYAIAVLVSVVVAPSVFHHYLAVLVLPLLLGLSGGVRVRILVVAYLLLWGGQQAGLGDWAWVLSRVPQTLGWILLAGALVVATRRSEDPSPALPARAT